MQLAVLCVLMLAVYEPLLVHAKKLVVVFPRQIRRSPMIPWRQKSPNFKKTSYRNNEFYNMHHNHRAPHFYGPKPVYHRDPPFPHGGDDFDHGYEVNHVRIPHSKDISHAISFGKGYVPYDSIRGTFSLDNDKYTEMIEYVNKYTEPSHASTNYSPTGSEYNTPPSGYMQENIFSDSYFSDVKNMDLQERKNEDAKNYIPRAIGNELTKTMNGVFEMNRDVNPKNPAYYKNTDYQDHKAEGAVIVPAGIPSATIGGSKEGIIFRDSVSLDDYNKKVEGFTKNWPRLLGADSLPQSPIISSISSIDDSTLLQQQQQQQQHQQQHQQQLINPLPSPAALIGPSYPISGPNWFSEFAQSKRGYAVKEELMEPPHDFRTMPIQTSPLQNFPIGINVGPSVLPPMIHAR
ncbi:uncharacterized protein LOC122627013 [Vespula pensylvanica]|nr:uncharacterized protein LOC122627013 [Vespula pensylvanica]